MSTIKTDRFDFEKLLNGIDPVEGNVQDSSNTVQQSQPQQSGVVDNTSAAETMNVKMFQFDYDGTKKGLRKKARKSILNIINHIVPKDIINENYIQDKLEQDIDTLTELYMQVELNTVMQRSLMESVCSGNAMPRMYEVFGQMTDKIQAINKQIVDTEQRIRKTYVDLKFEVRDKQGEDFSIGIEQQPNQTSQIEAQKGLVVTSTKSLIAGAHKKHIDAINKVKEAKFEESE